MCSEPAMRAPFSGCSAREFLADRHQAGHFGLGDGDFLAAPVGKRQVGDDDSRWKSWRIRMTTAFITPSFP